MTLSVVQDRPEPSDLEGIEFTLEEIQAFFEEQGVVLELHKGIGGAIGGDEMREYPYFEGHPVAKFNPEILKYKINPRGIAFLTGI